MIRLLFSGFVIATLAAAPVLAAEPQWTLLTSAASSREEVKTCRAVATAINKAGKGLIRITSKVLRRDADGMAVLRRVRKGRAVMGCVAAAAYLRLLPEAGVVSSSNAAPDYVRANGGMAALDRLHRRVLGVTYLGWIDSGVAQYLFLPAPPAFNQDGLPVLAPWTVALGPMEQAFLRALGANTLLSTQGQRLAAVHRGQAQALVGWATGGMAARRHHRLRYRLAPGFYQSDLGLLANFRAWRKMGPRVRMLVARAVARFEQARRQDRIRETLLEAQTSRRYGVQTHLVPAADAYLARARDSADRYLAGLIRQQGRSLAFLTLLQRHFRR